MAPSKARVSAHGRVRERMLNWLSKVRLGFVKLQWQYTKALRKAASSVFCIFAKFQTQPVSKFLNVSKIFDYNCFKKLWNILFLFCKNVTKLIKKLRLHFEGKNICFEAKNVRFKATDLQKMPSFVLCSFVKFETRPVCIKNIALKSFQNFCKILIPTQILIEYLITIMTCRTLIAIMYFFPGVCNSLVDALVSINI